MIPEQSQPRPSESAVVETTPEHRCPNEATRVARSMEQQTCNLGDVHWVAVSDAFYCDQHYVSGRMVHLDGTISEHPPMPLEGLTNVSAP